jgi:glycosyltransferase involved in cell wall biosynthesis
MKISYGITVCNEAEELSKLLDFLLHTVDTNDEIIVLRDIGNTNSDVTRIMFKYYNAFKERDIVFSMADAELNKDFATFKNRLPELASGDYLMQLDADELPNQFLVENIKPILKINSDIDCFYIPRVNKVEGITDEHIKTWRWRMDEHQRINFPDMQMRLFKLNKDIKWKNRVHEVLDGYKTISTLPYDTEDFCLFHIKTIEKQTNQNAFYDTI